MRTRSVFIGSVFSAVVVAACGSTVLVSDGEGGSGGSADTATSGKSTSVKASSAQSSKASQVASSGTGVVSSASGQGSCDDIGLCSGDGFTPSSGCIECSVLGDSIVASDGGACLDEFVACFGDGSFECAGASEPECCPYYDCLQSCDGNFNGEIEPGMELDCYCLNDGVQCLPMQVPGTCLGDYPNGAATGTAWETCVFVEVCPFSCGGG